MYRKNTASQFVCFQMLLTATGAVATGLSPAVRRCIDGTFAAGGGTVTEDGSTGSYKYAMAQADTNGNDISLIFSAATAMPVCINFVTTAGDPTDSVRFGLTSLPNAAASAVGGLPVAVDTSGRVDILKVNGTSQTARDLGAQLDAAVSTRATVTGIWQDATAGDFTAANSIGKSIMNGVSLGTGLTIASVSGAVGSVTGAVGSVTGAVGSVTGNVGGNVVGSVASVTARVTANTDQLNGDATAAANIAKTTKVIGRGTASGVPTTTSIPTSAFTPNGAAADQFKGRIITFDADTATTALRGQSTDITASSNAAAPVFTVTALTTAPASGDTFSVT